MGPSPGPGGRENSTRAESGPRALPPLRHLRHPVARRRRHLPEHARAARAARAIWSPSCATIGLADAVRDEHGYVMATIPATTKKPDVPVIGFIAHVDTSPEMSGAGRQADRPPRNWRARHRAARRPDRRAARWPRFPYLGEHIGNDIVTASGTTLLGADNKAGVAEIVAAAEYLMAHPEIPHGAIRDRASRPTRRWGRAPALRRGAFRRRATPTPWTAAPRGELEYRDLLRRRDDHHVPRLQHPSRLRQGPDGQLDQGGRRLHRAPAAPTACRPRPPRAARASSTRT